MFSIAIASLEIFKFVYMSILNIFFFCFNFDIVVYLYLNQDKKVAVVIILGIWHSFLNILDSIVVSIPACHAGDRGSIPRRGVFKFLLGLHFLLIYY